MYKNIIAIALLSCVQLTAQTDTTFTTIRQESTPPERQQYADVWPFLFRSLEPARVLFKWNALALWPAGGEALNQSALSAPAPKPNPHGLQLDLAAEVKIRSWLSVNVAGGLISGHLSPDLFVYDYIPRELSYAEIRVEPRLYFDMPRRIRAGQSADNFSGNYFGLEVSQAELFGHSGELHRLPERARTATLRFGVQRRLFRFGYFDLSYGLGWRSWEQKLFYQKSPRSEFFANSRVALGFALAAGTRQQVGRAGSWCDVTRCYREERRVWRIDLLQALVLDNARELHGELPVAYEQKFGESPFSVELEARLTYGHAQGYQNVFFDHTHINWIGGGLAVEPRYYFSLKNRIAQGRSGNNLSGPFLALRLQGRLEYAKASKNAAVEIKTKQAVALPVFGLQYRILRNGFIAYKAGFGASWSSESGSFIRHGPAVDMYWLSELKVGLAF